MYHSIVDVKKIVGIIFLETDHLTFNSYNNICLYSKKLNKNILGVKCARPSRSIVNGY